MDLIEQVLEFVTSHLITVVEMVYLLMVMEFEGLDHSNKLARSKQIFKWLIDLKVTGSGAL